MTKMMNDVIAGKTAAVRKTGKKRGVSVLRGGRGTASKCVGLTGSMLTYAISMGIIEHNVAHGIRKPKDQVRDRRLSEDEYRLLGKMLREASEDPELTPTIAITRLLALTGCRRGEILGLKWSEVDFENSCLRLADSKEGASTRPVGLPVIELLEERRKSVEGEFVFPGVRGSETFGSFPNQWNRIFDGDKLPDFMGLVGAPCGSIPSARTDNAELPANVLLDQVAVRVVRRQPSSVSRVRRRGGAKNPRLRRRRQPALLRLYERILRDRS